MAARAESGGIPDPEPPIDELQLFVAVDQAIHKSKAPPEQAELLRRHLHLLRDPDGSIRRADVWEALRRVRPALSLWAAGTEQAFKELQDGPLRRHLNVPLDNEDFNSEAEVQSLLDGVEPTIAILTKGAHVIVEYMRKESEAQGPSWPSSV